MAKPKKSGIHIDPAHKGEFRREVGAKSGKKLTEKQIDKGLNSKSPAERKRANFAKVARTWNHKKGK